MRTGMVRWLVLVIGALALPGCERSQSATTTKIALTPPAQPFVFYDETGEPSARTPVFAEFEIREVVRWMAARTSDPIWLIRVKPSASDGRRAGVIAYVVPDQATPRIRVGKAYYVAPFRGSIVATWEYVQIPLPSQRFTDQFTKPSVTDMPFRYPVVVDPNTKQESPMPQEEVIRIADFVRQPSNYQDPALKYPRHWSQGAPYAVPILGIRREGSRTFVSTGYVFNGLWGWAWSVRLACTAGGYRITSVEGPLIL